MTMINKIYYYLNVMREIEKISQVMKDIMNY